MRISPWWLLVAAIAGGAALTGIAGVIDGENPSALEWLGSTAGVAALVIAVGIYRLQERSGNEAHAELMGQIEAQGELLSEYANREEAGEAEADEGKAGGAEAAASPTAEPTEREGRQATPSPTSPVDSLTADQRAQIEAEYGVDSIESAFDPGRARGKRARARLVRLRDGRLVSVYEDPRRGRLTVREIDPTRRGFGRTPRDGR